MIVKIIGDVCGEFGGGGGAGLFVGGGGSSVGVKTRVIVDVDLGDCMVDLSDGVGSGVDEQ